MAERSDKQSRKEKLHEWRAQQRAAARSKLPLPDEQMQAMFGMLDTALPSRGCDHTLRLVRAWAEQQGLLFEPVAIWCHENGGHCDCEVLANCEDRWQDARHDVNWGVRRARYCVPVSGVVRTARNSVPYGCRPATEGVRLGSGDVA